MSTSVDHPPAKSYVPRRPAPDAAEVKDVHTRSDGLDDEDQPSEAQDSSFDYEQSLRDVLSSEDKGSLGNGLSNGTSARATGSLDHVGVINDSDDEGEGFLYDGVDGKAVTSVVASDSEALVVAPTDYEDQLDAILGNEGDVSGEALPDDGRPDSSVSGMDTSFDTVDSSQPSSNSFHLADVSISTTASVPTSRSGLPFALNGTGPRRRPSEYPLLSRLRNSLQAASSSSSSAGPSSLSRSVSSQQVPSPLYTPSIRSRASSISHTASIAGSDRTVLRRRFPYGQGMEYLHEADALPSSGSTSMLSSNGVLPPHADLTAGAPPGEHDRDMFRWSALRKITSKMFAAGRPGEAMPPETNSLAKLGRPTVLAVAGELVAVGTDKGWAVVFEYSQALRCVCGVEKLGEYSRSKRRAIRCSPLSPRASHSAAEAGSVTCLSFSADATFLGVGHSTGHIALYDLAHPSSPARHVVPVSDTAVTSGRREGHLFGSRILHLGFVGVRHTAIVSADDQGLSFCHTLGKILGVPSNDTLRIFGRYPQRDTDKARSGNPIIAMRPLPLGPLHHMSDRHHFVAILTAAKLVVVGLKPVAKTYYRHTAPRQGLTRLDSASSSAASVEPPDRTSSEGASGALSWYPASQVDEASSARYPGGIVHPVLAFSFGAHAFFLRVIHTRISAIATGGETRYKDEVELRDEGSWEAPQSVRALQWLSHKLLLVVTGAELLLYNHHNRRAEERQSLKPHLDRLLDIRWPGTGEHARRLAPLVGQSVRAHKGSAFFIVSATSRPAPQGHGELTPQRSASQTDSAIIVGSLISWADRILEFVSTGDFLSAIKLATAYYEGRAEGSLIGLPEHPDDQRKVIDTKLRELMSASVAYAFSPERLTDKTHVTPDGRGVDRTELFEGIARICTEACLALGDLTFVFEDLYDRYEENGIEGIFVSQMESFITAGHLRKLPIAVVQRLIAYRDAQGDLELVEQLIWHVDPTCLDIDQALTICLRHHLYDALIYVYNRVLGDYVAPLINLLEVLKQVLKRSDQARIDGELLLDDDPDRDEVYTIFSYLSVALSGRSYPSQEALSTEEALKAKMMIYSFVFSGSCVVWPPEGGGKLVLSVDVESSEPTYPYLRLFLRFDAEAFLDAIDIAFEDSYLDEEQSARRISRQLIINVLMEVSEDAEAERMSTGDEAGEDRETTDPPRLTDLDKTFIYIFVARNAPKFPQFVSLSPAVVQRLLVGLASLLADELREDRQLACECLLSTYRPVHSDELLLLFEQAGFYRILQSAYRAARKWDRLITMFLRDTDAGAEGSTDVFAQVAEVLAKASREKKEDGTTGAEELSGRIFDSVPELVHVSVQQTTSLVDRFYPERHTEALARLEDSPDQQLAYLRCFLDPRGRDAQQVFSADQLLSPLHLGVPLREHFIYLLCSYDPDALLRTLEAQETGYFDLDTVIETCEAQGAYAPVLWAINQRGNGAAVFDALDRAMASYESELRSASLPTPVSDERETPGDAIVHQLRSVSDIAVRICTERSSARAVKPAQTRTDLDTNTMWYRLLHSFVNLIHGIGSASEREKALLSDDDAMPASAGHLTDVLEQCRDVMQDTLSALVASTSAESVSYPALFKRLVEVSGEGSGEANGAPKQGRRYREVRWVLEGMMNAYHLRAELLQVTNRLFERDLFTSISALTKARRRGWRPASLAATCSRCGEALFGPSASSRTDARATPRSRQASSMSDSTVIDAVPRRPRRMRTGSEVEAEAAAASLPLRQPSPYHSPLPSPRPDKGKGVARDWGRNSISNILDGTEGASASHAEPGEAVDFFAAAPLAGGSGSNVVAGTPGSGLDGTRGPDGLLAPSARFGSVAAFGSAVDAHYGGSGSVGMDRRISSSSGLSVVSTVADEEDGMEEDEEVERDEGIVVVRTGEVWHRRCAPVEMRGEA